MKKDNKISRRKFLGVLGAGAVVGVAVLEGCKNINKQAADEYKSQVEPPKGKMTYRINPTTKDKISLLGYGMMRLPVEGGGASSRKNTAPIDQEMVNHLVDYAIDHGVNYFDTSPLYCQGNSEHATGIALHRHPRKSYFVATKMSNLDPNTQTREESIELFNNSIKELQVDYIDYYLLHGVGMKDGMEEFNNRFIKNGILDWILQQRKSGKIRNLGFSYHGDVKVFDYLLANHDKYHWDFVQIELNYLDWKHAKEINNLNTNADYLYTELEKRGIPAVIMEPLLGGRLSDVPAPIAVEMKKRDPQHSVASWAFRYAGSLKGVLTVLSGMAYMEHLKDNLLTYCPLKPVNDDEKVFLENIAQEMVGYGTIPCNDCKYCMPCPFGVNIPGVFVHYNKCKNEGILPKMSQDENYRKYRNEFLIGLDRSVPKLRQADHCIGCGQCKPHCPQNIDIPTELHKIDKYIEQLKQGIL
jgi:predicted aldo/keto reductase-like oxidoreductase